MITLDIKYSTLPAELMIKISTEGGIKWICALLESEHILMVNDGLLALTLLAALRNGIIALCLHKDELGIKMHVSFLQTLYLMQ